MRAVFFNAKTDLTCSRFCIRIVFAEIYFNLNHYSSEHLDKHFSTYMYMLNNLRIERHSQLYVHIIL